MLSIARPSLDSKEERAVIRVLRSGQLTQGKWVEMFEERFAAFIGTKYAVAVSNGTTALYLALLANGIKDGDEVITPSFSFIASANAVLFVGAQPVFVDVDPKTFTIDPRAIEKKITKRTKAILPVHLFGLPANMDSIRKIAKKHKLVVIEDACQAHGASIRRVRAGNLGDLACFSFYGTKNITTGEGGMITTNNKLIAERIRLLRSHGMKKQYYHQLYGFNFRMTNIAAAIGIEQLKKLPHFLRIRKENAEILRKGLQKSKNISLQVTPKRYTHANHLFSITFRSPGMREEAIKKLEKEGIQTGIYYPVPIHQQAFYKSQGYKDSLPSTETLSKTILSLPVHPAVKKRDLRVMIKVLNA